MMANLLNFPTRTQLQKRKGMAEGEKQKWSKIGPELKTEKKLDITDDELNGQKNT